LTRSHLVPLAAFAATCLLTAGPFVLALLIANARDPFLGMHCSADNSLDLLGLFVHGGHWRFAALTRVYWSRVSAGNIHESSVHLGLSVVGLLVYAWWRRRSLPLPNVQMWLFALLFFAVLALGPVLHVCGETCWTRYMPYCLLERLLPPLKMSGVPVRMAVMVSLCAAIIAAAAIKHIHARSRGPLVVWLLLVVLVVEYLPSPQAITRLDPAPYVQALADAPGQDGVVDTVANTCLALYYQTIYQKPMAFGYVSRVSTSVTRQEERIHDLIDTGDFAPLWHDYKLRYLVLPATAQRREAVRQTDILWQDEDVLVLDLRASGSTRSAAP
jgi:hypothetical protein